MADLAPPSLSSPNRTSFLQAGMQKEYLADPELQAGDKAQSELSSMTYGSMAEYRDKGGTANQFKVAGADIKKKQIQQQLTKRFNDILMQGESAADQAMKEAIGQYGKEITNWIPPKQLFIDPQTGDFDSYKYFERLTYGLAKYREYKQQGTENSYKERQMGQTDKGQQIQMGTAPEQIESVNKSAAGIKTSMDNGDIKNPADIMLAGKDNPQFAAQTMAGYYKGLQDQNTDLTRAARQAQQDLDNFKADPKNKPFNSLTLQTKISDAHTELRKATESREKAAKTKPVNEQALSELKQSEYTAKKTVKILEATRRAWDDYVIQNGGDATMDVYNQAAAYGTKQGEKDLLKEDAIMVSKIADMANKKLDKWGNFKTEAEKRGINPLDYAWYNPMTKLVEMKGENDPKKMTDYPVGKYNPNSYQQTRSSAPNGLSNTDKLKNTQGEEWYTSKHAEVKAKNPNASDDEIDNAIFNQLVKDGKIK